MKPRSADAPTKWAWMSCRICSCLSVIRIGGQQVRLASIINRLAESTDIPDRSQRAMQALEV